MSSNRCNCHLPTTKT